MKTMNNLLLMKNNTPNPELLHLYFCTCHPSIIVVCFLMDLNFIEFKVPFSFTFPLKMLNEATGTEINFDICHNYMKVGWCLNYDSLVINFYVITR